MRNRFRAKETKTRKEDTAMAFTLPELPYARNALAPHISEETLNFHYGKHHQAYVTNLNGLVEGTDLAGKSLEEIIKISAADKSKAGIFNNSAQVWNHTFYWHSMKPGGGGKPHGKAAELIERDLGGYDAFVKEFKQAGATQFGSGWAWLSYKGGKLVISKTPNAETPLTEEGTTPLMTMDVWEHAYYLDYQNRRPDYIDTFLGSLVNWDFVNQNLADAGA
ncbi:superoxide dismutase, Fe [Hyphomonas neptunium ATCC 15444]|uniref:Superoxide dismutase n=2 Tax=Hyphomonas TaxID=85 RepID=Q0C4B8_HYPNA|nr:superoxide dismutase, Fe [Hyphomonas neptunium ATCC 15444]